MGRKQRIHFQGAVYHAYDRGVDRRPIFFDDEDRRSFLEILHRIVLDSGAKIFAYCLMGNHFHLAIQVAIVPLGAIMQRLLSQYGMRFNLRHERTGHLFEARHHADLCLDDRHLLALINYIHMNPVRAGLVSSPEDWPWSSYVPGSSVDDGFQNFDPWKDLRSEVNLVRVPEAESSSLDSIGSFVAVQAGIETTVIRSGVKEPAVVAARRAIVQEAVKNGHALKAAANWLNITRRSASRYLRERIVPPADLTPIVDKS